MSLLGPDPAEQLEIQKQLNAFTWQAQAATWVFFAAATVIFFMRTAARFLLTEASYGWEDILISLSWLLDIVRQVSFQLALSYTRNVDVSSLESAAATIPNATFWAIFVDTWAFLSITIPKLGVAVLLVRIFRPKPWARVALLGSAIGLITICIVGFILSFVQCSPVAGQWDPFNNPETVCWSRSVFTDYALFASSCSATLDFAYAVYPAVVVFQLQMSLSKKLTTVAFMGIGFAAFAFAIVKVDSNATLLGNLPLFDVYQHAIQIGLWNSIEGDMVLIAACLPGARPWFLRRSGKTKKDSYNNNNSGTGFSTFTSRHRNERHIPLEEQEIAISQYGQAPGTTDRVIHVKHDFTLHHEETNVNGSMSGSTNDVSESSPRPNYGTRQDW